MTLVQESAFHFILMVIIIAVALTIFGVSNLSATGINDQVKSKFDKDKLKVNPLISNNSKPICFNINTGSLTITESEPLFTGYNEFVKSEEFVLTLDVAGGVSGKYQLSSRETITCKAENGKCSNFLSHNPVEFVFDTRELPEEYAEISVWKAIGVPANDVFIGSTDTLIRQKADYYLTTFRIYRCD